MLLAAVIGLVLTGLVIRAAEAGAWAGDVAPGVQRFHTHWVTRLGGVAVLLTLAAWLLLGPLGLPEGRAALWLACLMPAFLAGLCEDLTGRIGPAVRLLLTLGGAATAWLVLEVQVLRLGPSALDALLQQWPLASLLLSALMVGGAAHAVNIIDGVNGLAATYALLSFLAIAHVAGAVGDPQLAGIALGAAVATAAFLAWNFPLGRVFLGDGGAYLLGTVIAFLLVRLVRDHEQVSPMFAALLMAYPVWETLFSMHRKLVLRGQSAMRPDGLHLHMLVYKRLARSCGALRPGEQVLRNSATTLYALPLLLGAVIPAAAFWDDGLTLLTFCALLVLGYLRLYRGLVRFGMPSALRLSALLDMVAANRASSASAIVSTEKSLATLAAPARPSRARSGASAASVRIAAASARTSPGGTSSPAPSPSSSGTPPTAGAMAGRPKAIASISATGMPSSRLASTTPSTVRRAYHCSRRSRGS